MDLFSRIRFNSAEIPEVHPVSSVNNFLEMDIDVTKQIRMLSPFNVMTFRKTYTYDNEAYIHFEGSPILAVGEEKAIIFDTTGSTSIETDG